MLAEQEMDYEQIRQEIIDRSGNSGLHHGIFNGALEKLEKDGLIHSKGWDTHGYQHYELTIEGGQYVAEHPEELQVPW